jgi:hypothetical protein
VLHVDTEHIKTGLQVKYLASVIQRDTPYSTIYDKRKKNNQAANSKTLKKFELAIVESTADIYKNA